jgi:hypothetical protein
LGGAVGSNLWGAGPFLRGRGGNPLRTVRRFDRGNLGLPSALGAAKWGSLDGYSNSARI